MSFISNLFEGIINFLGSLYPTFRNINNFIGTLLPALVVYQTVYFIIGLFGRGNLSRLRKNINMEL